MKITKNNLSFNVIDNYANCFWQTLQDNKWEPNTFKIFDQFVKSDKNIIDLGSWIGPTILYNSQLAKHCYAIEPDPIAFEVLRNNVNLNPSFRNKITLFNGCISNQCGVVNLFNNIFGNSMSSMIDNCKKSCIEVPSLTLQKFIEVNNITDCNFIKMDIEGGEVVVLPTIKDYLTIEKITLHLSLHSQLFNKQDIDIIIESLINYDNIYDNNGSSLKLKDLSNRLYRGEQPDIVCVMN